MTTPKRFSAVRAGLFALAGMLSICAAETGSAQELNVTPYHKSAIYKIGETVGWNIALPEGMTAPTNSYTYHILKNNQTDIKSGEVDLSSGKTKIESSLDEPGMLQLEIAMPRGVQAPRGGYNNNGGLGPNRGYLYGAAIAPTEIKPSQPIPDDFDSFWKGKLDELAKIPVNPELTTNQSAKTNVEFYTVKLDSVGSHVQGYLAKPARPGKFPAILYYQYAGVYALDKNVSMNRAAQGWLIFNVDSHDQQPDQATAPRGYAAQGNTNRETCYFLNMYLRDHRAVDYLTSRPDWDGKVLVAMGISMGGQQSLVTAGLDPRVTHVIVEVPSGTDLDGPKFGRSDGYPNWRLDNPLVVATAPYFDAVNFASHIKATTFLAMGFRDRTSSPVGDWIAFNQVKGPKQIAPMAQAGHNHQSSADQQKEWADVSEKWLNTLVTGGEIKPDTSRVNP